MAQSRSHVQPGGERDHRQAGIERQREIEREMHHQHGDGLADDRDPAQPHQRVDADVAAGLQRLSEILGHGMNVTVRMGASSAVDGCAAK
jgi:hypothetical protein